MSRQNKKATNNHSCITGKHFLMCTTFVALFCFLFRVETALATATHGKEREGDGAYSPRDKHHGEGENHNSKFDHEAILGKM